MTADGSVLAQIPGDRHRVQTRISEDDWISAADAQEEMFLELSVERARGWNAQLDGEPLAAATEGSTGAEQLPWMRRFHLPQDAAAEELTGSSLTVGHRSALQLPILVFVGTLLVLVVLIALPLPRSWRLLPIASREQLHAGSSRQGPLNPRAGDDP
ncbi:hypothetical protein [Nesterenkonia pannonica]|uniref:hypothetical protein n=1 Tax=Nesterenkonia pannonica TaxID=1548602 RepID=UPI0021649D9B|nr:hypothetical protein [Nesterenkonia pannonica]